MSNLEISLINEIGSTLLENNLNIPIKLKYDLLVNKKLKTTIITINVNHYIPFYFIEDLNDTIKKRLNKDVKLHKLKIVGDGKLEVDTDNLPGLNLYAHYIENTFSRTINVDTEEDLSDINKILGIEDGNMTRSNSIARDIYYWIQKEKDRLHNCVRDIIEHYKVYDTNVVRNITIS